MLKTTSTLFAVAFTFISILWNSLIWVTQDNVRTAETVSISVNGKIDPMSLTYTVIGNGTLADNKGLVMIEIEDIYSLIKSISKETNLRKFQINLAVKNSKELSSGGLLKILKSLCVEANKCKCTDKLIINLIYANGE